jgi:hypothetical protein
MTLADDLEAIPSALLDENDELRKTAARLAAQLAKEKSRTEALVNAVYEAARDAALVVGHATPSRPPKDRRTKHAEVALLHTTDWQGGKVTEDFDLDVLAARIKEVTARVARITEVQRADHPVNECHILLGGDMVEGINIFPGQAYEIGAHLYEQMFRVGAIIEELVLDHLALFEKVIVWDIFGNHGRIGRRGESPRGDNIDRMMYRITMDKFTDHPRVTWHHADSWKQYVEIGNYRALFVHGDQVKSYGGNLPAYGIIKKVLAWASGVLEPFQDTYIGHYHTQQELRTANGGVIYMTGSPESGSEYATEFIAAKGRPKQRLHFIDPEKARVTSRYDIGLD